jgi:hypothetical protein
MATGPKVGPTEVVIYDATLRDTAPEAGYSYVGSGHGTMWWSDGFHYSSDQGQTNGHFTDHNEPKESEYRHLPPEDAHDGWEGN